MLKSTNFSGLFNERFVNNLLPLPATDKLYLEVCPPDFELLNVQDGNAVKLSSYRNQKPLVLVLIRILTEHQYSQTTSTYLQLLNENYPKFLELGSDILVIASTDDRQSKVVVKNLGLKMPFLSDPKCLVFHKYGAGQGLGGPLPAQFVLDKQGKLRYRHLFSFFQPHAAVSRLLAEIESLA